MSENEYRIGFEIQKCCAEIADSFEKRCSQTYMNWVEKVERHWDTIFCTNWKAISYRDKLLLITGNGESIIIDRLQQLDDAFMKYIQNELPVLAECLSNNLRDHIDSLEMNLTARFSKECSMTLEDHKNYIHFLKEKFDINHGKSEDCSTLPKLVVAVIMNKWITSSWGGRMLSRILISDVTINQRAEYLLQFAKNEKLLKKQAAWMEKAFWIERLRNGAPEDIQNLSKHIRNCGEEIYSKQFE